ncbi:MAG TPA: transglycosylase family protein, partial [Acidimicrobiales bacterium]|nr:transglycosylase family protein [Acidimicrobiales bacterium]
MRTPRPAALAATFSVAALLAVTDLPSGPGDATAHERSPSADLAALRDCESDGNYRTNTGNGYYGAYQFSASTWKSLGYGGLPHAAPPNVQDEAALRLASTKGWSHWPACARSLGLRGRAASPPPPAPVPEG